MEAPGRGGTCRRAELRLDDRDFGDVGAEVRTLAVEVRDVALPLLARASLVHRHQRTIFNLGRTEQLHLLESNAPCSFCNSVSRPCPFQTPISTVILA